MAVGIEAYVDTEFTVIVDGGEPESFALEDGEQRSFEGTDTIDVAASQGGTFLLVVNGKEIKLAGNPETPLHRLFTPDSYLEEGSTPTPSR